MMDRIADGRTDLVFDLVAEGHSTGTTDDGGVSLIQWCAYYGDVSAIRFLVSKGASLDALGDDRGLGTAAFHGHWRLVQFLLEQGADATRADPQNGETPLHGAITKAQRPAFDHVVRLLLAHGADPNAATIPGRDTGCFMRDVRTKGETPLHRAAAFGTEEVVQILLDAGARREALDAAGDSPLSWASWHLRPGPILEKLCFGEFSVHPKGVALMNSDHGNGWGAMEAHLVGRPHMSDRA